MDDLRTVLLSLHVAGGLAGLAIGVFALRPPGGGSQTPLGAAYVGSLGVLVVFLTALVVVDWSGLDTVTRVVFGGLTVFGFVVLARGVLAMRAERARRPGWRSVYMNHVYFTYISLWEGLVIVALLDLGAPGWAVAAVAVVLVVGGAQLFHRFRERVLAEREGPAAGPSPMT